MTKLHFGYKDLFRALRLGFSAKKIWMMSLGLLVGFAGYALLTYLAYLVAGADLLTVWQSFRLLPFPLPLDHSFPWYAWATYSAGVLFFLCALLLTGTSVSKVCYEQLRGDEFYESREAFRFAFRHGRAVLFSPALIVAFLGLIAAGGLALGGLGAIPAAGEIVVGLLSPLAFIASLFIAYLLLVLLVCLLFAPSVVGATRSDTFDTLFEVFSCINEQPGRLVWYATTVAILAKAGSFLLGLASSVAGRIGYGILAIFMRTKIQDVVSNASFYFKVRLPDWCPTPVHQLLLANANLYGLPQIYLPGDYLPISWSVDVAALLLGACFYLVALVVVGFGMSVWFSGTTLAYAVLAQKKDEKNILDLPENEAELLEPVVKPEGMEPPAPTVP
ncbi:hypothetical protein FJY69_05725 [candidate division WOR-3 bacterium]|nr:hypothetical protein [candidate division WOR-3 bacterium]